MAIKRFSGSFRTRDDVFDNITPNNMVQPKVSHPAGEWKPAAWLPVQWKGEASKDYFVISSGKVVSLDASGRVVPSGIRKRLPTAAGSGLSLTATASVATVATILGETILTYTSLDVAAKTEDIRTGVAVTAADTVTIQEFCEAVIQRGWVAESDVDLSNANTNSFGGQALSNTASGFLFDVASTQKVSDIMYQAQQVIELFLSKPVGICAYDVYSWAGDTPASLKFINYQKQHLIQFITEAQMKMPQMASKTQQTSAALTSGLTAWAVQSGTANGQNMPMGNAAYILTRSTLRDLERYNVSSDEVLHVSASAPVVGFYLGNASGGTADALEIVPANGGLIASEVNTAVVGSADMATLVVNKKNKIADIAKEGDYFVDYSKGIVFVHASDGATTPITNSSTVKFYQYGGASSEDHQHIYFVGTCKPGDHITWDFESNFIVDANPAFGTTLGRVLEIQEFPKSLMERTTTAWQGSSFDASMRMPGTATQGLPDNLTLAGQNDEVVGNRMVIANIRIL
jgi:hypothetical protein